MTVQRQVFIVAFAFLCSLYGSAPAQQPAAISDWQRVKTLSPGVVIDIKSTRMHLKCKLSDVTDETLTCTHGSALTTEVFQCTAIAWIKIGRRGRSALIGAGIGAGTLATIGFAATTGHGNGFFGPNFERGPATGVGALAGGVIGAGIGALTDFSKTTIYKAP